MLLLALGVGEIVVKSAGDAAVLLVKGAKATSVAPERDVKPIDSTAAGDSFNAAYLAARGFAVLTFDYRGIGASLKWTEEEFRRYSRACGGCLSIVKPEDIVTGRRVPNPTRVVNVFAIQRGTTEPNRVGVE